MNQQNKAPLVEIGVNDLKAGDVLLSYGDGFISDAIRLIDGGKYSHAALFDGSKIVEAGLRGVVHTPLELEIGAQKYVDAYRFQSDTGMPLAPPDWPADPVIQRAHYYLEKGTRYADNQLYLVGVLIVLKRLTFSRVEKAVMQALLAMVFKLFKRIADGGEVKSVVCSELVYRSFYEALPEKKYGLTIKGAFAALQASVDSDFDSLLQNDSGPALNDAAQPYELDPEYQDLLEQTENLYRQIEPGLFAPERQDLLEAASPFVAAEMVSPHDLQRSPNLKLIGRLRKPA